MALSVGTKAPDFSVPDQDGKTIRLSDYQGKKVVLYFYPRDMTPGCTAEACNLRDNYSLLLKQGYTIFGISTDNEKTHRKFIEKEKLPFSLLADTDKTVHHKYGTWVEKSLYGRKYMGTARVTFVIDESGRIQEIIEKVDTKNHASQILSNGSSIPSKPAAKSPSKKLSAKKSIRKKAPKKAAKKARRKTGKK